MSEAPEKVRVSKVPEDKDLHLNFNDDSVSLSYLSSMHKEHILSGNALGFQTEADIISIITCGALID